MFRRNSPTLLTVSLITIRKNSPMGAVCYLMFGLGNFQHLWPLFQDCLKLNSYFERLCWGFLQEDFLMEAALSSKSNLYHLIALDPCLERCWQVFLRKQLKKYEILINTISEISDQILEIFLTGFFYRIESYHLGNSRLYYVGWSKIQWRLVRNTSQWHISHSTWNNMRANYSTWTIRYKVRNFKNINVCLITNNESTLWCLLFSSLISFLRQHTLWHENTISRRSMS